MAGLDGLGRLSDALAHVTGRDRGSMERDVGRCTGRIGLGMAMGSPCCRFDPRDRAWVEGMGTVVGRDGANAFVVFRDVVATLRDEGDEVGVRTIRVVTEADTGLDPAGLATSMGDVWLADAEVEARSGHIRGRCDDVVARRVVGALVAVRADATAWVGMLPSGLDGEGGSIGVNLAGDGGSADLVRGVAEWAAGLAGPGRRWMLRAGRPGRLASSWWTAEIERRVRAPSGSSATLGAIAGREAARATADWLLGTGAPQELVYGFDALAGGRGR